MMCGQDTVGQQQPGVLILHLCVLTAAACSAHLINIVLDTGLKADRKLGIWKEVGKKGW